MKRKNLDYPKLRRSSRRNKINENIYGSTFLYIKFFLIWAIVLLADFILEFRFEYLWPFWLLLRSVYDSFKYQGLAFSIFFICIALTSDMICLLSIPVHWLFFAASTYVWVQFIWHTERGICLPTISLWLLFVYIEASVRLRELKNVPFHLDLCRPFAAHCIGYPMVTLGFGFKSYIGYRLRQKRQRDIAKENNFYHELLQKALPNDMQHKEFDLADALSSYTNNAERFKTNSNLSNGNAKQLLANSLDDFTLSNGGSLVTHQNNGHVIGNGHCGSLAEGSGKRGNNGRESGFGSNPPPSTYLAASRLATFLFSAFTTCSKNDFYYAPSPSTSKSRRHPSPSFLPDDNDDDEDDPYAADDYESAVRDDYANSSKNKGNSSAVGRSKSFTRKKGITYSTAGGVGTSVLTKAPPFVAASDDGKGDRDQRSDPSDLSRNGSSVTSFGSEPGESIYMEVRTPGGGGPRRSDAGKSCAPNVNHNRKNSSASSSLIDNRDGGDDRPTESPVDRIVCTNSNTGTSPLAAATAVTTNGGYCFNNNLTLNGGVVGGSVNTGSSLKDANKFAAYKRPTKNSNLMDTSYLQKDSQIDPNNTVPKDDNIVSSKFVAPVKDEPLNNFIKLEHDLKRYKTDLHASRMNEQELREHIAIYQSTEKAIKTELVQFRQDNESLQNKIHNLVNLKQQDKQMIASLEKKLSDELKFRAKLETQLTEKKVQIKRQTEESLTNYGTKTCVSECNELCKNRRKDLENDIRQLCRDAKSREDQIWILEKELQTLRKVKNTDVEKELIVSALTTLKSRVAHLETNLTAETKLKLDLFSALSEAKRNLEINQSVLNKRDQEINELKSRMAEAMALSPSSPPSPPSNGSVVGVHRVVATGGTRYSPLSSSGTSSTFYNNNYAPSPLFGNCSLLSGGSGSPLSSSVVNGYGASSPCPSSPPSSGLPFLTPPSQHNSNNGSAGFATSFNKGGTSPQNNSPHYHFSSSSVSAAPTSSCNNNVAMVTKDEATCYLMCNNMNTNNNNNNITTTNGCGGVLGSIGIDAQQQLLHKLNPSAPVYNPGPAPPP